MTVVYSTKKGWARVEAQTQQGVVFYAVMLRTGDASPQEYTLERTYGATDLQKAKDWADYLANE